MKFEEGQKVRIKSWDKMAFQYGVNTRGYINVPGPFLPEMKNLCKKVVVIAKIKDKNNIIVEGSEWVFSTEMFEQPGIRSTL